MKHQCSQSKIQKWLNQRKWEKSKTVSSFKTINHKICFYGQKVIVHQECLFWLKVNAAFYIKVLTSMGECEKEATLQIVKHCMAPLSWQHTGPHNSLHTQHNFGKSYTNSMIVMPCPSYLSNLAPCTFFLFWKQKMKLKVDTDLR